jgi:hypothetical protein
MPAKLSPEQPREQVTGRDIARNKVITLEKTHPKQLTLWQTYLPGDHEADDYSNTVELYDAVPKYFASKQRMAQLRKEGQFLTSLKRSFKHKGVTYQVTIRPARIEEKNGTEKEYYPSWREELVEEALKKIACDELNGVYLNNIAGVQFSLYELRKELRSRGHDIHFDDLLKSLRICREASIVISCDEKEDFEINSPIFPVLVIRNRREWESNPKHTRCYVQFNPLITHSINKIAYRQFDYVKSMAFNRQLARWFHKRLSHNYVQASLTGPAYGIKMSTVIRDSALVNASRVRDNMRYIDKSLDELVEREVIYKYEKKISEGTRGKIEEVLYTLHPTMQFITQVKKANKRKKYLVDSAHQSGILSEEAMRAMMYNHPASGIK